MAASQYGNLEVVKVLVAAGADINVMTDIVRRGGARITALHMCGREIYDLNV